MRKEPQFYPLLARNYSGQSLGTVGLVAATPILGLFRTSFFEKHTLYPTFRRRVDGKKQARLRFGIQAQYFHIDTTSFSVSGDYPTKEEGDPVPSAITYCSSRDHHADLKQWMCALATTHDGDIPIFLRPLVRNICGNPMSSTLLIKNDGKPLTGETFGTGYWNE